MMRSKLDKEHFEDKRILPKIYEERKKEERILHGGETVRRNAADGEEICCGTR